MALPTPSDDYEQSVFDNIRDHGWHCTSVGSGDGHPAFSYSIGLFQTYDHPELVILGLSPELSNGILWEVARAAERGAPLDLSKPYIGLLEDVPCQFVEVPKEIYGDYVFSARWYYQGDGFPLFQIVWPDLDGLFPWSPGADDANFANQPVLGESGS